MGELDLNNFIDDGSDPHEMADIIGDVKTTDEGYSPAQGVAPDPPQKVESDFSALPGSVVLPPIPPLGTEKGRNPVPVPIVHAHRAAAPVPPPVPAQPARQLVLLLYQFERSVKAAIVGTPAQPVAPRPPGTPPINSETQEARPAPVAPKSQPSALSVGSTSTRGALPVEIMKQRPLPLGSVSDQVNPAAQQQVRAVQSQLTAAKNGLTRPGRLSHLVRARTVAPTAVPQAPRRQVYRRFYLAMIDPGHAAVEAPLGLSAPKPVKEKKAHNSQGIKEGSKNPIPPMPLPDSDAEVGDGSGLKGEYYLGHDFDQLVFTRADPAIDFYWGGDDSPSPRLAVGGDWTVRWTGKVQPLHSETYTFYASADDGVRVWVNHKLLIDDWTLHPNTEFSGDVKLDKDQQYDIRIDYYEGGGPPAGVQLYWESPSQPKQFIPSKCLFYPLAGDKVNLDADEPPHR